MKRDLIPKGLRRHSMTENRVNFDMAIDKFPVAEPPKPQQSPNATSNLALSDISNHLDLSGESITVEKPHVHE
jgi:hypothetical protein